MENWAATVVFLIQMLLTFGGRCNRYFSDIRLKMLRLPNFNMLFQLVLTKVFKSELFSCLPKVGHCDQVMIILLGTISGAGLLLKTLNEIKDYKKKIELCKFAYTTYEKVLVDLQASLRGAEFNEND